MRAPAQIRSRLIYATNPMLRHLRVANEAVLSTQHRLLESGAGGGAASVSITRPGMWRSL